MIVRGGFDNNVFWLKTGGISTRLRVETGDPVGAIYDAPFEVQLSDTTMVQPDISHFFEEAPGSSDGAWSRRRARPGGGNSRAPDGAARHGNKAEINMRTGVVELWIVDPAVDEVKIYQSREDAQLPATTLGVGGTLSTLLLPGLSIDLARVFES